jgi:hypothetical protein
VGQDGDDTRVIWIGREAKIFFAMGLDSADHTKSSPSDALFFGGIGRGNYAPT